MANSDDENRLEPTAGAGDGGDHPQHPETIAAESTTAVAAAVDGHRSGRQFYQQPAAAFAYQPYPQRRAYHKSPGQSKKRLNKYRTKPGEGGRRRLRPRRRPSVSGPLSMSGPPAMSGPPPSMGTGSRYRRLPGPAAVMRPQHVNYVDPAGGADYDDGFEPAPLMPMSSFDYGEFDHESANSYAYGPQTVAAGGRPRKRPVAAVGYADETRPTAIVHVPVRVVRPAALPTPSTTAAAAAGDSTADPMEKLRRLVHEAMDEHFANRHQELYGEGFGKQHQSNSQQVYSAKYKRQQADKHAGHPPQWSATAAASATQSPSAVKTTKDADVDADGSDDRLTLAEISAYMGAKPAETVLSAGGHRYVLSDALQQSYRQQQHHHQQQQQQQYDGGEDRHQSQYLRYVSPFEALYELPAARWTYK